MSNERKNRENDQLVSDVYRILARERTPDRLDQEVLRLAGHQGRTRYSRTRAWIRPMAWATTIGLCFAIMLEVSRLPSIEPDSIRIAVPGENRVSELDQLSNHEFVPQGMEILREAEDMARAQAGPDQAPVSDLACPLKVRQSAESWWACIETLRDDGQERLADSEYEAFQQVFPGFVGPHTDK